jgi:hypothetical protein
LEDFGVSQTVPLLEDPKDVCEVLRVSAAGMNEKEARGIAKAIINKPIVGLKRLLMVAEMAKQGSGGASMSMSLWNVFILSGIFNQ